MKFFTLMLSTIVYCWDPLLPKINQIKSSQVNEMMLDYTAGSGQASQHTRRLPPCAALFQPRARALKPCGGGRCLISLLQHTTYHHTMCKPYTDILDSRVCEGL